MKKRLFVIFSRFRVTICTHVYLCRLPSRISMHSMDEKLRATFLISWWGCIAYTTLSLFSFRLPLVLLMSFKLGDSNSSSYEWPDNPTNLSLLFTVPSSSVFPLVPAAVPFKPSLGQKINRTKLVADRPHNHNNSANEIIDAPIKSPIRPPISLTRLPRPYSSSSVEAELISSW